jgi:Tol biopolymer transport system component
MRPSRKRALIGATVAAALATIGFAGQAQANTTLPGLNGRIAFTSSRDFPFAVETPELRGTESSCSAYDGCSEEIYSMGPDGSTPTRLTNNELLDDEAAWLPTDGSGIAFERSSDGDCSDCADIWSMASAGGSEVQLTSSSGDETHPTYSPDGSHIAYAGDGPTNTDTIASDRLISTGIYREIFTMPAGGGPATPLLAPDMFGSDGYAGVY